MEKYFISLDLDDTLLNKRKKLPLLTRIGLNALLQNGHYIILNTGRPLQGVLPYIKKLKLYNYPFICSNGCCIYYINRKNQITKSYPYLLDTGSVNDFLKEVKEFLVYACLQGINDCFYFRPDKVPSFMQFEESFVRTEIIEDFTVKDTVFFAAFAVSEPAEEKLQKLLQKKKYRDFALLCWGRSDGIAYYDLHPVGANKGIAMMDLAKRLKIPEERILAFGDEMNDIPMLIQAHEGCVMPKGKEIGKKYGLKILTKDSDHAGVIRYLFRNHRHLF